MGLDITAIIDRLAIVAIKKSVESVVSIIAVVSML